MICSELHPLQQQQHQNKRGSRVIRTWGACKQYREEVDADSDGIEKRKGSEAVGDGVHLRRSVSETVLPVQQE